MKALRRTSVVISAICIALTTIFWMGVTFQETFKWTDFWQATLFVAAVDLFFIGILWAPHRLKDSKYANAAVWIAFGLSLIPVVAFFYLLHMISQIQC